MRSLLATVIMLCPTLVARAAEPGDSSPRLSAADRTRLTALLTDALGLRESAVSIHAAEALIALDDPAPVLPAFRQQAAATTPGYRCGVWRVLAKSETDEEARRSSLDRLRAVLADPAAPDRIHAMESLAKIAAPIESENERALVRAAADEEAGAAFALWRLAQAGDDATIERLTRLLKSDDWVARLRAGYVLSRLRPLPAASEQALAAALAAEPAESLARPILVFAVGGPEVRRMARTSASPVSRYWAAMALAGGGSIDDRPLLRSLVDDPDADVRVAAAFALMNLDDRLGETEPSPKSGD